MADIRNPLSSAMKTRARVAIDADATARGITADYDGWTPRQLRALILSQNDSDSVRSAMRSEGWFTNATATSDGRFVFISASNQTVDTSA
jgi:hypothetical protein